MKLGIKKTVQVNAKELRLCLKVCDGFTAHVYDDQGEELGGQNAS